MENISNKKDLVEKIKAGDYEALKALEDECKKAVRKVTYAHKIYYTAMYDKEDLLAETVEKAWTCIGLYKDEYEFEAWVYTICKNIMLGQIRYDNAQKREGVVLSLYMEAEDGNEINRADFVKSEESAEEAVLRSGCRLDLDSYLKENLTEDQYKVLHLHTFLDEEIKDVAKELGMKADKVSRDKRRAIEKLEKLAKEDHNLRLIYDGIQKK